MDRVVNQAESIPRKLGVQLVDGSKNYVLSPYQYSHEYEGKILWFNILTREMLCLEKGEEVPREYLIKNWWMIPDDVSPKSIAWFLSQSMRAEYINSIQTVRRTDVVTVMTTTACNARCGYCYERGMEVSTMSPEMALRVAEALLEACGDNLLICWFGGEPLCNTEAMDIITEYLEEKGVSVRSNIITNGYLIDEHSEYEWVHKWHVVFAQVAIDGMPEEYRKVKNFKNGDKNPFEKVMNNIQYLLDMGIEVSIRLNVGKDNCDELYRLTEFLVEKFGDEEKLQIYCARIGDVDADLDVEGDFTINRGIERIERLILTRKVGYFNDKNVFEIKYHHCMCDSMTEFCIMPDGRLSLCESEFDVAVAGDVDSWVTDNDRVEYWRTKRKEVPECESCMHYPRCYCLDRCIGDMKCSEASRDYYEYSMRIGMEIAYRKERSRE